MTGTSVDRKAALSFGRAAAHYDRIRPGYPVEAVRWAIGDPAARVVDLGAGTGILTREFRHSVTQTAGGLLDLVRSRSVYLTAPPQRQAELDAAVRDFCDRLARRLGTETFEMPYVTFAYRAIRLP